jgi:DNA-binding transcriptional LysR family regulator
VPLGHRLATKRSVTAQDLSSEKFIFREAGSATRAVVATHLRKLRVDVAAVMEIENPESVKKAVQNGLGIAFISGFAAATDLKAKTLVGVKIRNVKIRRELKIVYRRDKHLSRAAQAFIEVASK